MKSFLLGMVLVISLALLAACATENKYDNGASSSGPDMQYGGQFRVRATSSSGINQLHTQPEPQQK